MRPADVVLVYALTKWRSAVVFRVLDAGRLLVICGTGSEPRDEAVTRVRVDPAARAGKALGLDKITYFTPRTVAIASASSVRALPGRQCLPGLFLELEALIG